MVDAAVGQGDDGLVEQAEAVAVDDAADRIEMADGFGHGRLEAGLERGQGRVFRRAEIVQGVRQGARDAVGVQATGGQFQAHHRRDEARFGQARRHRDRLEFLGQGFRLALAARRRNIAEGLVRQAGCRLAAERTGAQDGADLA